MEKIIALKNEIEELLKTIEKYNIKVNMEEINRISRELDEIIDKYKP